MTQNGPGARVWRSIGIFLLHSACATAGVLVLTFALLGLGSTLFPEPAGPVVAVPLANFHPGPPEAFWHRLMYRPFDSPFLGEIALGLILGFTINLLLRSKSAKWAWTLPLAWFLLLVATNGPVYPPQDTFLHVIWRDYFGFQPADEGFVQFVATVPLLGSIAYSLGAWLALRRLRRNPGPLPQSAGAG
jgi:hypothetical protein